MSDASHAHARRCLDCENHFTPNNADLTCPRCHSNRTSPIIPFQPVKDENLRRENVKNSKDEVPNNSIIQYLIIIGALMILVSPIRYTVYDQMKIQVPPNQYTELSLRANAGNIVTISAYANVHGFGHGDLVNGERPILNVYIIDDSGYATYKTGSIDSSIFFHNNKFDQWKRLEADWGEYLSFQVPASSTWHIVLENLNDRVVYMSDVAKDVDLTVYVQPVTFLSYYGVGLIILGVVIEVKGYYERQKGHVHQ